MIKADEIKRVVRDRYASSLASGCCGDGSSCCTTSTADPARQEVAPEVEGSIGPSLGCGTPLAYAELKTGEVVVDLGSGAGREVMLAARQVGQTGRAIGVDMTPEMIWTARENASRSAISNVDFRLGELEHLPVSDAAADVVISNCVINLVPDKPKAFAEAHRILKPGGRIVVSDMVTRGPLPKSTRQNLAAWAGCIAGAVDVDEYMKTIERAGFRQIELLTQTDVAPGQVFSVTISAIKPE